MRCRPRRSRLKPPAADLEAPFAVAPSAGKEQRPISLGQNPSFRADLERSLGEVERAVRDGMASAHDAARKGKRMLVARLELKRARTDRGICGHTLPRGLVPDELRSGERGKRGEERGYGKLHFLNYTTCAARKFSENAHVQIMQRGDDPGIAQSSSISALKNVFPFLGNVAVAVSPSPKSPSTSVVDETGSAVPSWNAATVSEP